MMRGALHETARPPGRQSRRIVAGATVAAGHLALAAALLWLRTALPPRVQPETALQVSFVAQPKNSSAAVDAEALLNMAIPALPAVSAPSITIARAADTSDLLSDAQLAGAASAGEGSGGGGCDLDRAVQLALRRDPLVRMAVTDAGRLGKASLLWNGDWVRAGGQEGKGLAAVRQAVLFEVGFAPQACRNAPMHGLVLLSLADGRTRFAIGANSWRWSDLLGVSSR
ncbi:MAG: hypothetical protein JO256_01360 [Alphaproteobacteria bacterium]|nr:hypothetical protein [Alphaproteobacteria bacterium]